MRPLPEPKQVALDASPRGRRQVDAHHRRVEAEFTGLLGGEVAVLPGSERVQLLHTRSYRAHAARVRQNVLHITKLRNPIPGLGEFHRACSETSGNMAGVTSPARRSTVPLIAVSVVVVLLVAVIGGELFVRQQIKSCLAGQLESELGSQVEVGLGFKPVLLSLVDKKVRR